MAVKKIGFDFDKVFVNYPPVIPDKLIDFLYKGKITLKKGRDSESIKLQYRIPGQLEQKIRILSHHHLFRPPIIKNILALEKFNKEKNQKTYLISSRFGFLKDKTNEWLDRNKIKSHFHEIHFNFKNVQPHIFKEKTILNNRISHYVDDDLDLLVYLSKKNPNLNLFWLTKNKKHNYKNLSKNIRIIKELGDLYKRYI